MPTLPSLDRGRRRGTIAVQIYHRLRNSIVTGELVPRQVLSENEISASLGVSRTPVREAFSKLEEDELIQIVPQYGTCVAPIVPERVFSNQFVREALECAAVGLAATRCSAADAAGLQAILDRQRAADSDAELFPADEAMHALLMAIGGQEHAWEVVAAAKLHLDRVRHLVGRSPIKRSSIIREHRAIVERVTAGDSAGAVEAMRTHLRGVSCSINVAMREHPGFFSDVATMMQPGRRTARTAHAK